jgi:hydroxyacylglutathione hydrolase
MLRGIETGASLTPELTGSAHGPALKRPECDARIQQLDYIGQEEAAGQPLFLDLRPASLFARGFIPGSINTSSADCLQLLSRFPEFNGQSCYVIAASAVNRHAARASLESCRGIRVAGWLRPEVIRQWARTRGELACLEELEPDRLAIRIAAWKTVVLDVRDYDSFAAGHIPEALHISLLSLRDSVSGLPEGTPLSLVCNSGERAGFAASLLRKMGYTNLAILRGGFKAYAERGLPVARHAIAPLDYTRS